MEPGSILSISSICLVALMFMTMIRVTYLQTDLSRTQRKLDALLRHFQIDPNQGLVLSDRVKELLRDPMKKIEAIKVYREETGASLVDAKNAVEAYVRVE